MSDVIRVGIDVGGTFTKAVALGAGDDPVATAVVATSHDAAGGVAAGVAEALQALIGDLDDQSRRISLVTFSTTQAMNALLEGDVAPVAVLGIGAKPDLRAARRRTRIGDVKLAPGRVLRTVHEFLDATDELDPAAVDAALERARDAGCRSVAASGAFAVDAPDHEELVLERSLAHGLPACAGHDLTGVYGLEMRTLSAAINASILPIVEETAGYVTGALEAAGLDVPLLVLRGDGGAMSAGSFLRRPAYTIGSGPAAGVSAALHQLAITDGIVVECGGTSSNVSVVRRGRAMLRTLRVMGRPTSIRSIDSWVVGVAGGSMARVERRRVAQVGPRSAHIAGLPYACFAAAGDLAGAGLEWVAPRPGDPAQYAALVDGDRRWAITATCAANALGLVPAGAYAEGSRTAAVAAFSLLGERLRCDAETAARRVLDTAVAAVARAVDDAARQHDLDPSVPLVALGGAGDVLVPEVARVLGRDVLRPRHAEVLSSIGAAVSLVRAEVVRSAGTATPAELAREAERAAVEAGAAPATVAVETTADGREGVLRAVATGAVALESGTAHRAQVDEHARRRAAAHALACDEHDLQAVGGNEYYRIFSRGEDVAAVDATGAVPLLERARHVTVGVGAAFVEDVAAAAADATLALGIATMLPRVIVIAGPHLLDLSDARHLEGLVEAARRAVEEHPDEPAFAVVAR